MPRCLTLLCLLLLAATACERPSSATQLAAVPPVDTTTETTAAATPTLAPTPAIPQSTRTPSPTSSPAASPTPFYTGPQSAACGQVLPLLPPPGETAVTAVSPNPAALADLEARLPAAARPAWQQLRDAPETVGLVAYQVGDEANGVYFNADVAMPLASVVKILHLAAYAEAVASGELNPTSYVNTTDMARFYLPRYDLGAHAKALAELDADNLILANPARVRLEDVPWMMIRHSSNAATDYLHDLLGQARIENTAVSLGLTTQTAPCPFIGQFLAMANHTRASNGRSEVDAYLADPANYGQEASLLADAFSRDSTFREAELAWRNGRMRPSVQTQAYFSARLNAHASPRDYATLMARLAQNGLSNPESSFLARRYLEWPMQFADNQRYFSNVGYKNGSLPGILTTAYYAYRQGDAAPVVVILFYRDLPMPTYRQWRWQLPHDELARWLLIDPEAIPLVTAVLTN